MATEPEEEPILEKFEPAFAKALTDLQRYDRRNVMMLRRWRWLAIVCVVALLLGGGGLAFAVKTNSDRIADIQRARAASILFACQQQNAAHIHTLVFLDKTELERLHAHIGPAHYPAIERHTLAVLHRQPAKGRDMLLSNHRLLLAFIDNLAPLENCRARALALTTGRIRPAPRKTAN